MIRWRHWVQVTKGHFFSFYVGSEDAWVKISISIFQSQPGARQVPNQHEVTGEKAATADTQPISETEQEVKRLEAEIKRLQQNYQVKYSKTCI